MDLFFLEHDDASIFAGASVGVCSKTLSLNLLPKFKDAEITVQFASHSELLNNERPLGGVVVNNSQLLLPLSALVNEVQVLKIVASKGGNTYKNYVALLPSPDLPKVCIVVGSPRSGTTVVGNMIQQAYGTKAHGESHLAELFSGLISHADEYLTNSQAAKNKGTMVWEMPSLLVKAQLIKQLRDIYITYYGNEVVVDKTPGIPMLKSLPLLISAFPSAKVVYCQRRGIENVASRLRKFPNAKFDVHCKQWTQTLKIWKRMKTQLSTVLGSSSWCLEVEQYELATAPSKVTDEIGFFLQVGKGAINRMFRYQERKAPQVTSGKPSDVTSLNAVNWTEQQKAYFIETCGELMKEQGYSLDESYYFNEAQ